MTTLRLYACSDDIVYVVHVPTVCTSLTIQIRNEIKLIPVNGRGDKRARNV